MSCSGVLPGVSTFKPMKEAVVRRPCDNGGIETL